MTCCGHISGCILNPNGRITYDYDKKVKVLSTKEPELVFSYLLKNKAVMPRVAYRYALEKIDTEKKIILMAKGGTAI